MEFAGATSSGCACSSEQRIRRSAPHGIVRPTYSVESYSTKFRKLRFGSVRSLINPVQAPTVRFQNPVPTVLVSPVPNKKSKTPTIT